VFFHESPQQISSGSFNMSYQKCCPSFLFAGPGIGMLLCGWCLVRRLLTVYRFFLSCFCGDVSYLRSVSGDLELVSTFCEIAGSFTWCGGMCFDWRRIAFYVVWIQNIVSIFLCSASVLFRLQMAKLSRSRGGHSRRSGWMRSSS
jgi:hypothetical protein